MKPETRTGTASLAVSLVLAGAGLLAANLVQGLKLFWVLRFWPVVPIVLGIEIACRAVAAGRRGARLAWDPAALALIVILTLGLLAGSQWPAIQRALTGSPPLESYTLVHQEVLALGPETAELEVRQSFGPVRLFPWEGPGVRLEARVTGQGQTIAEAEANARDLAFETTTGRTLFLMPQYPAREGREETEAPSVIAAQPAWAASPVHGTPALAVADLRLYVPPQITRVRVQNSFGDIEATALKSSLEATGPSGRIRVEDLAGDLRLEGAFFQGAFVSGVQGRSLLRLDGTAVEVRDCAGPVVLEASSAPVRILRPGGALEVTSHQAEVEIDTDQAPQADWRVETEFAPLRVVLPADSSVKLEATARFGSISPPPEFRLEVTEGVTRLSHTLGAGEHLIQLDSLHSSITIDLR